MFEVDPEDLFEKSKAGKPQEDFELLTAWNWSSDFEIREALEVDSDE